MIEKRFLKYVSFDTQSDENSSSTPSTLKQLELANYLASELEDIGCKNIELTNEGIVYATVPSNVLDKVETIGLIAHMDTSDEASGLNVKPRKIVDYDGEKIVLNQEKNIVLDPAIFESLKSNIHQDLIVTDGNTLLGADDKAGIAIIVQTIDEIIQDESIKHGDIKIAFTPDEEVGRGTENFDVKYFNADYAYTLDGGDISIIEKENFNAASCLVTITGKSIHPGYAKNKMVNPNLVAIEFDSLLPKDEIPVKTEGREGFHHLCDMQGNAEIAKLNYIIRNHDKDTLYRQIDDFKFVMEKLNQKYGYEVVKLEIRESYQNMNEILDKNPHVLKRVEDAYKSLNLDYRYEPIRGGTDGAFLTFEGLPCPNLGTGGYNFHGVYEYVSITQMKKMVEIVKEIVKIKE